MANRKILEYNALMVLSWQKKGKVFENESDAIVKRMHSPPLT